MNKIQMIEAANTAKFQMEFAIMMLNCGRTEEANTAFTKAAKELAKFKAEKEETA